MLHPDAPPVEFCGFELARILDDCEDRMLTFEPLTLRVASRNSLARDWDAWCEGILQQILAPHLVAVMEFARRDCPAELLEMDALLSTSLGELGHSIALASTTLGRRVLHHSGRPRHLRCPVRLQEAVRDNNSPGHFATVYGMLTGIFQIPLTQTLEGYVHIELQATRRCFPNDPICWPALYDQIPRVVQSALENDPRNQAFLAIG